MKMGLGLGLTNNKKGGSGGSTAPTLSGLSINDTTDTITITSDIACRLYWRVNATGGNPDAATIIAGGGDDSGSVDISAGGNVEPLTFTTGLSGTYQISFAARVEPSGTASNVLSGSIDIETTTSTQVEVSAVLTNETASTFTTPALSAGDTLVIFVLRNNSTSLVQADCDTGTLRASNTNNGTHVNGVWTHKVTADAGSGISVTHGGTRCVVAVCTGADYNAAGAASYLTGSSQDWPSVSSADKGLVLHLQSRRTGTTGNTFTPTLPTLNPTLPVSEGYWDESGTYLRFMLARPQTGTTSATQSILPDTSAYLSLISVSLDPV